METTPPGNSPGVELVVAARRRDVGRVRALLDAGADPNTKVPFDPPFQAHSGTALYYAAGVHADHELTRLLLRAGADPNDTESIYHAMEHHDGALLHVIASESRVPLDGGQWSYALLHLMDFESPECLEAYLAISAARPGLFDPNHRHPQTGETALHWAIKRGRSIGIISRLLDAGTDPGVRAYDGRSAYGFAASMGDVTSLELIEARGYRETLDGPTTLLIAAARHDRAAVDALLRADPDLRTKFTEAHRQSLTEAAWAGRLEAVRGFVELAGLDVATPMPRGATALHYAAFNGDLAMASYLLSAGHPVGPEERQFNATPLGWGIWASGQPAGGAPRGDHAGIVELLLAHGAERPGAASGSEAVRLVLAKFGVGATPK